MGCGGEATEAKVSGSAAAIDAAMTNARTLRYEGEQEIEDPEAEIGHDTIRFEGFVDYERRYATLKSTGALEIDVAMAEGDSRTFLRRPTGEWCWFREPDVFGPLDLENQRFPSPFAPVESWERKGARLSLVGREEVRAEGADHYRVDDGDTHFDIWVDDEDRLVRWRETVKEDGVTSVSDFEAFDFGVKVPPEDDARSAPKCENA
jgi:hypothetical protein